MPLAGATKTVAEVVTYVQRQFGDESGAQVTDADILRWTNAAQLEIARQTDYSQDLATTVSVADQEGYSLPGVDILTVKSIYYKGKPLNHISFNTYQESILSQQPEDSDNSGIPTVWYEWKDSIYLYPIPDTSGEAIKLYFTKKPTLLTLTTDTLSAPDSLWQAIIQFVMAQAYELDDDLQGSTYKTNQLKEMLGSIDTTSSQKYYPIITVLAEDADL
jgi:hypothetical protein